MAVFTVRTVADNDEAYERSDSSFFSISSGGGSADRIIYGRSGAGGNPFWYSGWRFDNVTIGNGANINSAKLTFVPNATNTINAVNCVIYANDVDDASDFNTEADVVSRTLTTANVNWTTPTTFTVDVALDTADFTSVVQEIVDRGSWASGNAMVILLRPDTGTAGEDQRVKLFSDDSSKAPLLTIDYDPVETFTPKVAMIL